MIELHSIPTRGPDRETSSRETQVGDWLHRVELSGELDLHTFAATVRTARHPYTSTCRSTCPGLTFIGCAPATASLS